MQQGAPYQSLGLLQDCVAGNFGCAGELGEDPGRYRPNIALAPSRMGVRLRAGVARQVMRGKTRE